MAIGPPLTLRYAKRYPIQPDYVVVYRFSNKIPRSWQENDTGSVVTRGRNV